MTKIAMSLGYYVIMFLIITVACDITISGTNGQDTEAPDLALTITAQAVLLEASIQPNTQPTDQVEDTPLSAFTPTRKPTSAPEFTATSSVTTVMVAVDTNCRAGPGTQYEQVDALVVGKSAEVVGKNTPTNYWIIKKPNGSGTCWLWGQHATVSGNTNSLTEYAIPATPTLPPTPTLTPTAIPVHAITELQAINVSCSPGGNNDIGLLADLVWRDNSNAEIGIRIYDITNGTLMEVLQPNTTFYEFSYFAPDPTIVIGVQPFDSNGPIDHVEITVRCP